MTLYKFRIIIMYDGNNDIYFHLDKSDCRENSESS